MIALFIVSFAFKLKIVQSAIYYVYSFIILNIQSNTTASQLDIDIDIKGIGLILLSDLTLAFRASTVKENKSINKHINKSSHPKFVGIYCKTNFPNFQSSIQILPISMSIIKKLEQHCIIEKNIIFENNKNNQPPNC